MPPTATANPVLTALRADIESKQADVAKIIGDPAATPEQLTRAKSLADELPALQSRYEQIRDTDSRLSASKDWASAPNRSLPFAGGGSAGLGGLKLVGPDGRQVRIDAGESEVDRKRMTGGFSSLGHFAYAQWKRGRTNDGESWAVKACRDWDELQRKGYQAVLEEKAPSGLFEESDPDGGDLIPPQFSNQIYERMVAMNQILAHLSPLTLTGNTITIPALKEDSRADGSRGGGVLGYWQAEAAQYTKTKPQFRDLNLRLHKLTVLCYTTEELLNDSPTAIDTYIGKRAAAEINFKMNDAIINGGGNGMPLGILNSPSKITASAVSGQGAGTFTYNNVTAMFARIIAGQRNSLAWLYNQDVEPQMFLMYQATGTTGVPIFIPNQDGGFNLLGRKTLVMEQCQTLGTEGDVIAFATDGYCCATKGGIQSFMSMHLRFDYDEFAYKFRFRFDGQPYDLNPLTPFKGSNTVSSIVTLNSTRT